MTIVYLIAVLFTGEATAIAAFPDAASCEGSAKRATAVAEYSNPNSDTNPIFLCVTSL